ncbi:hypothetical protein KGF56_004558 [Candida oxycetoniae]|uniref:Uncharacterized protein n=1 Tax=Candida oxycetoniae TaxID=497107 RepID=A0AAI9WW56_9ASCO|nr:uncharacterized protein KGF56_004558 [Candida oxycetoniae]KAI3402677.2 hypothetical protein KGF56_004558 [Candida oxycetoniae]
MFKPTREANLRSKFLSSYGHNTKFYTILKQYKEDWGNTLFILDEELAKHYWLFSKHHLFIGEKELSVRLHELEVTLVDENYINFRFNTCLNLETVVGKEKTLLHLQQNSPVGLQKSTNRNASVIAVGGHITSMQWLPKDYSKNNNDNSSYLAIAVINKDGGLAALQPTSKELSVFSNLHAQKLESAIQIWKYNASLDEITLEKILVTSNFGAVTDIQWAPLYTDGNVIGVLAGVFKDGTVRILKISHTLPKFSRINTPSLSFYSNDPLLPANNNYVSRITCFAFHGSNKLLAGTADGFILEFELPFLTQHDNNGNNNNNNDDDDDISNSSPNYKTFVSPGPISSIVSIRTSAAATSTTPAAANTTTDRNSMILINGQASRGVAFLDANPIQDIYAPLHEKSNIKPTYNYLLQDVLVTTQNLESAKTLSLRSLQDTASETLRLSAYITACKLSEVLGHPFMLTGTNAGDIVIMNYSRKFLSSRGKGKASSPLKIWKFQADNTNDDTLTLIGDYEKLEVESPVPASYMPKEVMISSVAWNENVIGASVYAAGTASGVLLIERLDPSKQSRKI